MTDRSLDELMWLIADEGDPQTVEAFLKRHPEHRHELLQRVNMVRQMRGAKPNSTQAKFQPRAEPLPFPNLDQSRRFPWEWVAGFAFAALAFGVTFQLTRPTPPSDSTVATLSQQQEQQPITPPALGHDPNANVVPPTPPPPPRPTPIESLVALDSSGMDLMAIFNEITRQTGLLIEIGPGFQTTTVEARYPGMPALAVLRDLGVRGGFSVFDQGTDRVLIIPAVDPNTPTENPASPPPREVEPSNTDAPQLTTENP